MCVSDVTEVWNVFIVGITPRTAINRSRWNTIRTHSLSRCWTTKSESQISFAIFAVSTRKTMLGCAWTVSSAGQSAGRLELERACEFRRPWLMPRSQCGAMAERGTRGQFVLVSETAWAIWFCPSSKEIMETGPLRTGPPGFWLADYTITLYVLYGST